MDRTAPREHRIKKLDQLHQGYVEFECWKRDLEVQKAEVILLDIDMQLADQRTRIAELKLLEDTAAVSQEHGGVAIVSRLVETLRNEAFIAHSRYDGARTAFKEALVRQEKRSKALASAGLSGAIRSGR